jgi:hypothetical protein
MTRTSNRALILFSLTGALLATTGCPRRAAPAHDNAGATGSAAGGTAGVAAAAPPGVGMTGVTTPIMNLLRDERAARPTDTVAVEAVFAAVTKAGIPTHDQTQVLARTLGASFCENAQTDQGVVLIVCEFKNADTLTQGRAYSLKAFGNALPNRHLLANRNTLLTVNPPGNSEPVTAQLKVIDRVFASL